MEKQFITEEEKARFNDLSNREEQIIVGLGQLEYQIQLMELEKENIITQLSQLRQDQTKVGQELTEKYGDGNVDLNTGEFTKA